MSDPFSPYPKSHFFPPYTNPGPFSPQNPGPFPPQNPGPFPPHTNPGPFPPHTIPDPFPSDTIPDPLPSHTMTNPFPQQLKDAAENWSNYCTAFAQLDASNNRIQVRVQAPQIMWQFTGSVHFGKDPLGLLFYGAQSDFEVEDAQFKVTYSPGRNSVTCVRIDFFEEGKTTPFARWISNVDTKINSLPPSSNEVGSGKWKPFKALTSQAKIQKITTSTRIRIRFQPIGKQVYFESVPTSDDLPISTHGTLIAIDLSQLEGDTSVDYAPDRIVFYRTNNPANVLALVLPSSPLKLTQPSYSKPPSAKWTNYTPSSTSSFQATSFRALSTDAHEFPAGLRTHALPSAEDFPEDLHELETDYKIEGLDPIEA